MASDLLTINNPPSREEILEAAKNDQVLASRGEGTLLTFPVVRELIAEGKAEIVDGLDIDGNYFSYLKVA